MSNPPRLFEWGVVKHGSHDQKTHGGGGKGGAGGAGEGTLAEGGVNLSVRNHRAEAKQIEADIEADGGSAALKDVQDARTNISGEVGPLSTKNTSPQDMRSSLRQSSYSLNAAGTKLTAEGKTQLASRVKSLAQKVINTHNNTPNY